MKTWEMIKELTENPNKKFKRVGDELEVSLDIDNSLLWKSGHAPFNINHRWEEVKEPVDFMAVVAKSEHVPKISIRLVYEKYNVKYKNEYLSNVLDYLRVNFASFEIAEIILNGKWYIEEE